MPLEEIYEKHNILKKRVKALYLIIGGLVVLVLAGGFVVNMVKSIGAWPLVLGGVGAFAIYQLTRPKPESFYDIIEKIKKEVHRLDGMPSLGDSFENVEGRSIISPDILSVRFGGKKGITFHYNMMLRKIHGAEYTDLDDIQNRIDKSKFLQNIGLKEQTERMTEEQLRKLGFSND